MRATHLKEVFDSLRLFCENRSVDEVGYEIKWQHQRLMKIFRELCKDLPDNCEDGGCQEVHKKDQRSWNWPFSCQMDSKPHGRLGKVILIDSWINRKNYKPKPSPKPKPVVRRLFEKAQTKLGFSLSKSPHNTEREEYISNKKDGGQCPVLAAPNLRQHGIVRIHLQKRRMHDRAASLRDCYLIFSMFESAVFMLTLKFLGQAP